MANPVLSFAGWVASHLPSSIKQGLYQLGPISRLVRSVLNRAAPGGLVTVEITAGGLAGYKLSLDLQREKDYWLGTYELYLQAALREIVRPGMVAYDVGANIGYISLLLAKAVGESGRVYAFEALPHNLERLRANLGLNTARGRIEVVEAAVVEATHPVRFLVGPSGGMGKAEGSAGREHITYEDELDLDGLSLDQFVFERGHPAPQGHFA